MISTSRVTQPSNMVKDIRRTLDEYLRSNQCSPDQSKTVMSVFAKQFYEYDNIAYLHFFFYICFAGNSGQVSVSKRGALILHQAVRQVQFGNNQKM